MNARRLTRDAVLTGIALIIYIVEAQLPPLTAIPGIRMGLSNIVTLYAVFMLGRKDAALILMCRILLGALIAGNLSTLMYSAAGGACCLIVTLLLRRLLTEGQAWAAGVIGAAAHNLGQLGLAVLITRTAAIAAYLPVLTVGGMLTGLFTGLCAQFLIARQKRLDKEA